MPAQRRRKNAQGPSAPLQPKSVESSSDPVAVSKRVTPPGELSFIPDPETTSDAPAEHETAVVTDSQLDENPPADHDTPAVADAPDQEDSTVIEGTPDPEGAPQPEEDETNIDCEKCKFIFQSVGERLTHAIRRSHRPARKPYEGIFPP
ncbi:hypothetical protein FRC12_008531 [Ceratobasidium sp. 428]|nr:hypothetical protein FRC12_008531 [Ceratobasidium sp. 428]